MAVQAVLATWRATLLQSVHGEHGAVPVALHEPAEQGDATQAGTTLSTQAQEPSAALLASVPPVPVAGVAQEKA